MDLPDSTGSGDERGDERNEQDRHQDAGWGHEPNEHRAKPEDQRVGPDRPRGPPGQLDPARGQQDEQTDHQPEAEEVRREDHPGIIRARMPWSRVGVVRPVRCIAAGSGLVGRYPPGA